MEQSPSLETNCLSASQEIPRHLWNLKVHCRIQMGLPQVSMLKRLNSVHILASCITKHTAHQSTDDNSDTTEHHYAVKKKKVKLSRYMPWRHMGGEEV
jgi:hypothetical protein